MLNSKLIDILKTFSDNELKKFGEFLNSPYHNKNKKAVILFQILSGFHPGYENKNLTKDNLYTKIFGSGNKYNDASIRNLLSDLMILCEKFLAHSGFEKDKFEFNEFVLRGLIDRRLPEAFEKKIKLSFENFKGEKFEGERQFYKLFILEELRASCSQFSDNLKLFKDDSNFLASEYLTYHYLIKIFKIMNFFEFQKQLNVNYDSSIAMKMLKDINVENLIKNVREIEGNKSRSILMIYLKMYKAISNPASKEYYFDFKQSLLENDCLFSLLERYGLYVCLTNSCVQKIDLGMEEFAKECFAIYIIMIEKNLFDAYAGYFPMAAFTAIVNTGLAANEFKKVEELIDAYSERLNPAHKNDAVNFSMAKLCFQKKDYNKSLEFISKTDTDFSQFKFHLKILLLKIYYETEDYEAMYYVMDSFRHFLNKNKIVGSVFKKEFTAFVKILDLMVKYKGVKENKFRNEITQLLEDKSIAARSWLLEKFSQIRDK